EVSNKQQVNGMRTGARRNIVVVQAPAGKAAVYLSADLQYISSPVAGSPACRPAGQSGQAALISTAVSSGADDWKSDVAYVRTRRNGQSQSEPVIGSNVNTAAIPRVSV